MTEPVRKSYLDLIKTNLAAAERVIKFINSHSLSNLMMSSE